MHHRDMTISRSGYNARLDVDDRILVKRVHLMVASTLMLVSACACLPEKCGV
jgi:hypothetical protein